MRIFWNKSSDIFGYIHPNAIGGDTYNPVTTDDLFFIGNLNEFKIYKYEGYVVDRTTHNPPNVIVGLYDIDSLGYPVWKEVYLSLGLTALAIKNDTDGDYTKASYPEFNAAIDKIVTELPSFYSMSNREEYIVTDDAVFPTTSVEAADWDTVAGGGTPDFRADGVYPPSTGVPNTSFTFARTVSFSASGTVWWGPLKKVTSVRNNPLTRLALSSNGTGSVNLICEIFTLNASYTAYGTPTSHNITAIQSATNSGQVIERTEQEYFAVSHYLYTGSKPEQGAVSVVHVAADLTMSAEATIHAPVPARYGNFGRYNMTFCLVQNDSTYGEDLHLIVADVINEDLYIFSRERSWALHQTISFDRNDLAQDISGWGEFFVVRMFDDSASAYNAIYGYEYNGSTWVTTGNRTVSGNTFSNFIQALPGKRVAWLQGGNLYVTEKNLTTLLWTLYGAGYGLMHHGPGEYLSCNDSVTNDYIRVYDISSGYPGTLKAITDGTPIYNYPNTYVPDDAILHHQANSETDVYEGGTTITYNSGWSAFKTANANTRFDPAGARFAVNGSVTVGGVVISPKFISWAVSMDGGTNWQYYDGAAWQTADIDAASRTGNLADYSLFDDAMLDLAGDNVTQLDFCWRFDLTTTTENPCSIETFTIQHAETLETTKELEMSKGGINHTLLAATKLPNEKVTLDIYDSPNNEDYWVNLVFFDDLI